MNTKKVLEKLGYKEEVDFLLTENGFEMLEKTRQVVDYTVHHDEIPAVFETVNHPEVPATYDVIHHEEVPAVLDEEGNEISPIIEAWDEEILLTEAIEAWNEDVLVTPGHPEWDEHFYKDEAYIPEAPSEELLEATWIIVQLLDADVVMLIEYYKQLFINDLDPEKDNFSLKDGLLDQWNFTNIPRPETEDLLALIPQRESDKIMQDLIAAKSVEGEDMEKDCVKCLQFITGYNDGRIDGTQILTMMQSFGNINTALQNRMPKSAKKFLSQVSPDGTIVTQELLDGCLFILRKYPLL